MGDNLAIQNNLLITKGNLLSQCCCGSDEIYWEAVPCEYYTEPHEGCGQYQGCSVGRRWVSTRAICAGDEYVCECQRMVTSGWSSLLATSPQTFTLSLLTNYSRATGIASSDGFDLYVKYDPTNTVYHNNFTYSSYTTLQDFITAVNNYSPGGPQAFSISNNYANDNSIPDTIAHNTYTFASPSSQDVTNEAAGLYITWSGVRTAFIPWIDPPSFFALVAQTNLRLIAGLSEIEVTSDYQNDINDNKSFYITFKGEQCGILQDDLSLSYRWIGNGFKPSAPGIQYGNYTIGWGQEGTNYVLVPSGDTTCPYEDSAAGYTVFSDSIQCCPQRGVHLGSPQNLSNTSTYGIDFDNLENTVVIDNGVGVDRVGSCYKLSPFAFLFGKEGRFDDDPQHPGSTFAIPDCNYTATGTCSHDLPSNGQLELFIPRFSQDIPWGPFGSYHYGILDEAHAAYTLYINGDIGAGQNYPADQGFRGWNYAPSGAMRTFGAWTATTGIQIELQFYSYEPFWTGTSSPSYTNRRLGKIDTGTLSTAFTVASGNNCSGVTLLNYNCSGKTVMDFITDVNAIQTVSVSGYACSVFSFCKGAPTADLSAIPCSRINNLSAELYDVWKQNTAYNDGYLINDPQWDLDCYGGSTIWPYPVKWTKMFADDMTAGSKPNAFSGSTYAPARLMINPPTASRHDTYPKQASFDGTVRYNCRPYWLTMAGHQELVATISKAGGSYDPLARDTTISVSSGTVTVTVSSGVTILATTGINTIRASGTYTQADLVTDLNALVYSYYGIPASTYSPVVATSGNPGYPIYLDDHTWASAATVARGGTRTPTDPGTGSLTVPNFGYQEPLDNVSQTSIFNSSISLYSWVRERVVTSTPNTCGAGLPRNVVPWTASRVDPPVRLNCDGDTIIEGNWLLTYGCNSYTCKVEWFIRAQRCGCDTLPACSDDSQSAPVYVPHPLNQSKFVDCRTLVTPTFYMCDQNLHPDCDIPFLVKVPQMFVCQKNRDDCYFNYNGTSCWFHPDEPTNPCAYVSRCPAGTGDLDQYQVGYTTRHHGCQSSLTSSELSCWMTEPYDGWCQYIDPTNLTKVRRQDIPREWPPTTLVMERATSQFCTRNANVFDDGALGCGEPVDGGSAPYDALTPLWPFVPPEYIVPAGETHAGWPCFLAEFPDNFLYAFIRPIVKDFHASGLCDTTDCNILSIDCNTRCCKCGYVCKDPAGSCKDGPKRNCRQQQDITVTYTDTGPIGCCLISPVDITQPGGCNIGFGCNCVIVGQDPPALIGMPNCYDDTYTLTRSTTFTKNISIPVTQGYVKPASTCVEVNYDLGCCWGYSGLISTSYGRNGGCGGSCWWSCCGTPPPVSGCLGTTCTYAYVDNIECNRDISTLGPSFTDSSSGILYSHFECSDSQHGCGSNCTAIVYEFSQAYQDRDYLSTRDDCGIGSITWSLVDYTDLGSTDVDTGCGSGLGYKFGPGADGHGCTCGAWSGEWAYQGPGSRKTETGTLTYNSITCDTCNFDSVVGNTNYDYIINKQLGWSCGVANEITLSSSIFSDPGICPTGM